MWKPYSIDTCVEDKLTEQIVMSGQNRGVTIISEPWFVGKDVAEVLGYSNLNEAIKDHVDNEDKLNSKTLSSFKLNLGQRGGWLINESGLYSLILSSKMPDARRFKRWVTVDRYLSEIGFSPLVGKDSFTYERDKKSRRIKSPASIPFCTCNTYFVIIL